MEVGDRIERVPLVMCIVVVCLVKVARKSYVGFKKMSLKYSTAGSVIVGEGGSTSMMVRDEKIEMRARNRCESFFSFKFGGMFVCPYLCSIFA